MERRVISKEIVQATRVDQEADLHQEETDTEAEGTRAEAPHPLPAEGMREVHQDRAEARAEAKAIRELIDIMMTKEIKAN